MYYIRIFVAVLVLATCSYDVTSQLTSSTTCQDDGTNCQLATIIDKLNQISEQIDVGFRNHDAAVKSHHLQAHCDVEFNGWCYAFVVSKRSWMAASAHCAVSFGAHLADIQSALENKIVRDIVAEQGISVWVGGTDSEKEGQWKWSNSNEEFGYTDWQPGQPENLENQNCMAFIGATLKWHDANCLALNPSICKYKLQ